MNKTRYLLIQLNTVMLLMGYWFFHSMVTLGLGESSRVGSIIYDALQLILSLYVIVVCRRNLKIEKGYGSLTFFSILLALYSLRIIVDITVGPFVGRIPTIWMWNDFLMIVVSCFTSVWAMVISRKWIDVEKIVELIFWMGLLTILAILINMQSQGAIMSYEEDRMEGGQGLSTLSLVKIGAIVVLAALHLLLNHKSLFLYKLIYIAGIVLGGWLALASGSRGGVAGLVISLGIYLVFGFRKNKFVMIASILAVVLVITNIEPILIWMSDYFPILSRRMLASIIENDQSDRQDLRSAAMILILKHPILGYSYRLSPTPEGFTSHNGILDVFLALGIPIGILFVVKVYVQSMLMSVKLMTNRCFFFPSLMAVFVLVSSMSSSSITSPQFNFAICLLIIAYKSQMDNARSETLLKNAENKDIGAKTAKRLANGKNSSIERT